MTDSLKPIRVGMIRCDTHAAYYAALMAEHDPLRLRDPLQGRPFHKYSWEKGGAYFYFYSYYGDAQRMTVPFAGGFEIAKVWDEDREVAQIFSEVFDSPPQVCATFEEVSDDVDLVFIADCNGDGSDHLELTTPSMQKGVPTFLDKPFAYTVRDARALVELSRQTGTPLLCSSILLQLPQAGQFSSRLAEIAPVEFGLVKGGGSQMAGHIHSISLAQRVFGDGVVSVECMGEEPLAHVLLNYGGRSDRPARGVVLHHDAGGQPHGAFYVAAFSSQGAIYSPELGDWVYPQGALTIIERMKEMLRTGEAPVPHEILVEGIAIAEAARRAQAEHRRVTLAEVMAL